MEKNISDKLIIILILILVGAGGVSFYFYKKASTVKPSPDAAQAQNNTSDLVALVGKLIILPSGETPTIATVSDPEKLKDQAFFAKAKAGDKVLLYQAAKKAYLYDPVNKKILEVAPITLGDANVQNANATTSVNASSTAATNKN